MNNRGFTIVELLATLVILSIVVGISLAAFNFNFGSAKEKTEEVFVDSLKDAVDMYLSSNPSELKYESECSNRIIKKYGTVKVYKAVYKKTGVLRNDIIFNDVIDSTYKPITKEEFLNPANERECNVNAVINVYRDEDFVYYYSINKSGLDCLKNIGGDYASVITNLPLIGDNNGDGIEEYYSCY